MNILITGGCGFIGSNFIKYWLEEYPKDIITNIDKLTYAGHLSSTEDIDNENYFFIKGDICDKALVSREMKGVDLVVHFAAESHVDRSISNPLEFINTNLMGTFNLLEEAVKNEVGHFHYVSTDEVFGALPLDSHEEFDEGWKHDPRNPYAATKAGAEDLVRSYYHTYNLATTITNASNNYGPYQSPEKFIPRAITNLIAGDKIPIYGDGLYVRDWLYVKDHCKAIDKVINKGKAGETYLVGGLTENISNLDVAKKILSLMGLEETFLKYIKDRPGHDRRYAIDWTKINLELDWEPEFDFDTQLKSTIQWYLDNEKWWKPIKEEAEKFYAR